MKNFPAISDLRSNSHCFTWEEGKMTGVSDQINRQFVTQLYLRLDVNNVEINMSKQTVVLVTADSKSDKKNRLGSSSYHITSLVK